MAHSYVNSIEEHADFESLSRNRVSNVSFAVCSGGEIIILAVMGETLASTFLADCWRH